MEDYQEQHAIPQQISAYQFRLVGDMTLKQFFQLAGGALISLLIYSTTLPAAIKWPLIVISFLMGVAFAFFPLQDRPLAKWFELFFKAIYAPTLYIWKKSDVARQFFKPEDKDEKPVEIVETQTPPMLKTKKDEPQTPAEQMQEAQHVLEQTEVEFLSKVAQHLGPVKFKREDETETKDKVLQIPETKTVKTDQKGIVETQQDSKEKLGIDISSMTSKPTPFAQQSQSSQAHAATFTPEAAPPIPPTSPNIVVGQVLDSQGKILDNTILEIRDSYGRPTRALKTNKLGHFTIATPLYNGKYEIIVEKEGYEFDPISFEAKGDIFQPISIVAKPKTDSQIDNTQNTQETTVFTQNQSNQSN